MLLGSPEARAAFWRFTRLHSLIRASYQSQAGRRLAGTEARSNCPARRLRSDLFRTDRAAAGDRGFRRRSLGRVARAHRLVLSDRPVELLDRHRAGRRRAAGGLGRHRPEADDDRPARCAFAFARRKARDRVGGADHRHAGLPLGRSGDRPCPPRSRWAASTPWPPGCWKSAMTRGAKVILQGPCTYEVESARGGFLSLGKLTAQGGEEGQGVGSRRNPKSLIPHPTIHYPLFSVRTPTAVVTDLGTEFGVEVDEAGRAVRPRPPRQDRGAANVAPSPNSREKGRREGRAANPARRRRIGPRAEGNRGPRTDGDPRQGRRRRVRRSSRTPGRVC